MKKFFLGFLLLVSMSVFSQIEDGRFGVTLGATHYITDSNSFFTKSGTGFTIGVMGTIDLSDRVEIFSEINYNRHQVKFIGRENELADPEDIKFNLQQFNVPFIFNYNYIVLDDFKFGVNVGPSFNFIYTYEADDSYENYVLDPLYASPNDLRFDEQNEQVSFNMFAAIGLSAQYYENFMVNLRYYYGITDPYRQIPIVSQVSEIKGKDSYFTFTFTYLFDAY